MAFFVIFGPNSLTGSCWLVANVGTRATWPGPEVRGITEDGITEGGITGGVQNSRWKVWRYTGDGVVDQRKRLYWRTQFAMVRWEPYAGISADSIA